VSEEQSAHALYAVVILRTGVISLNDATYTAWGRPTFAHIAYQAGMLTLSGGDVAALGVFMIRHQKYQTPYFLHVRQWLQAQGIDHSRTWRYEPLIKGNLLSIDIVRGPKVEVIGPRTKSR
jgi:hypothetical protein